MSHSADEVSVGCADAFFTASQHAHKAAQAGAARWRCDYTAGVIKYIEQPFVIGRSSKDVIFRAPRYCRAGGIRCLVISDTGSEPVRQPVRTYYQNFNVMQTRRAYG